MTIDSILGIFLFSLGLIIYIYLIAFSYIFKKISLSRLFLFKSKLEYNTIKKPYFFSSTIKPIQKKLLNLTPKKIKGNLIKNIIYSGTKLELENIIFLKVSLMIIFAVLSLIFVQKPINYILKSTIILTLSLFGFMLPDFFILYKHKSRKKIIESSIPQFIDYLTICIESGLSLDSSVYKVISHTSGPLAEEIATAMTDIKYGKPRKSAFKDLATRINIQEFTTFINTLINGEELGVSLGSLLKIQSQQVREKRKQNIKEKAYKVPIKLLFPLVIFILPCIFVVILGPAVIQMMEVFLK